jgi:putative glycosyltransferase
MPSSNAHLSIVSTLYNSAPYLQEFYSRACAVASTITSRFEIIFVNDGSPDDSLERALEICRADQRVRVVDLSRNFGHHKAMMTGLFHAEGELVFLVDTDLEEEPELLGRFYQELKSQGADVVYGVQERRKGRLFERVSGAVFFKIFNFFSTHPIPANHLTARLMTHRYVVSLRQHREREFVMSGLWVLTGFKQIALSVRKHHKPSSAYGWKRKTALLVNAITSFSGKPLVFIFYIGAALSVVSTIAALDLIIRRIFFSALLQGWASVIISIWLLGGITIFSIGVIGIYLSKIFIEVKQRPYTIVRAIYGSDGFITDGPEASAREPVDRENVTAQVLKPLSEIRDLRGDGEGKGYGARS